MERCRSDPPASGAVSNGRGELLGDDLVDSKPVRVRIRWSDITPISAQMEQAISRDGGRSWETNLKMTLTRDD